MKNQKGSVLSVAIIVVMLLSFSITSLTAYTERVAARTNSSTAVRNETIVSDAYLRDAITQFRTQVQEWQQVGNYANFKALYDLEPVQAEINSIQSTFVKDIDDTLVITSNPIEPTTSTVYMEYTFTYTIASLNTTLQRKIILSIEPPDEAGTIDRIIDMFKEEHRDSIVDECMKENEDVYSEEVCLQKYEESLTSDGNANRNALTGDFYLDVDYLEDDGNNKNASLNLSGYMLIIDGNFYLNELGEISNGLIVVNGDLSILENENSRSFGLELNNVLILVNGKIDIEFLHENSNHGKLTGDQWAIMGFDGSSDNFNVKDYYSFNDQVNNLEDYETAYYNKSIATGDDYFVVRYVSDKEDNDVNVIIDRFRDDLDSSTEFIFDYFY